jgi:hypothetical protein
MVVNALCPSGHVGFTPSNAARALRMVEATGDGTGGMLDRDGCWPRWQALHADGAPRGASPRRAPETMDQAGIRSPTVR